MHPYLIILAGGISSRMKKPGSVELDPLLLRDANEKSKAMLGVGDAGRPFLDYLLLNAHAAGYRDVIIVVGEKDRSIRDHYGHRERQNRFIDLSISYAVQSLPSGRTKPLGTADALLCGLQSRPEWSGAKITVCNSDNLYSVEALRTLLESPETNSMIDYDRDALGFERERVQQFAVIQKDADGYLTSILEKPTAEEIARLVASKGRVGVSMNLFRFSYDLILPCLLHVPLHPVRQEKELPSAVMMLVADRPRAVKAYERAEYVPDLTDKSDIQLVRDYLRTAYQRTPWPPA